VDRRSGRHDGQIFPRRIRLVERFEFSRNANRINMPLRHHGAQPRFHRTSPVKIPEQRSLTRLSIRQSVKLTEKRIGKLSCFH